jgi:hypothetical protein
MFNMNLVTRLVISHTQKPWPDGLALAFQTHKPSQRHDEATTLAWLGPAYLGLAWLGSQLEAGPCTALIAFHADELLLTQVTRHDLKS